MGTIKFTVTRSAEDTTEETSGQYSHLGPPADFIDFFNPQIFAFVDGSLPAPQPHLTTIGVPQQPALASAAAQVQDVSVDC